MMSKVSLADTTQVDQFIDWLGVDRCFKAEEQHITATPGSFHHRVQLDNHWVIANACYYLRATKQQGIDLEKLLLTRLGLLVRLSQAKADLDAADGGRSAVPGRFAKLLLGAEGPNYVHELISAA